MRMIKFHHTSYEQQ